MKTIEEINKLFDEKFLDMSYMENEIWFANIFMPDGEPKKLVGEKDRIGLPMIYINAVKDFYTQQILSLIEELEGKKDLMKLQGYKNVKSWFKNFNYPVLEPDSKRCPVCGGKTILIRGRYPKMPKRKACPTCSVEIIESIVDNLSSLINGPAKNII